MKLLWTETAKQDLISIRRYIARDNRTAADRWVRRLRKKARCAVHAPYAGRKVPELSRDEIRELCEGNYRIVYFVSSRSVTVLTIFEGHRLFPEKSVTHYL